MQVRRRPLRPTGCRVASAVPRATAECASFRTGAARDNPVPEEWTMPFDGGDFSQFQFSEPLPLVPVPLGLGAKLAWLWHLFPGGRGVQSLLPDQADQTTEIRAAHLLRAARALIEFEETWTRGAYHTADGKRCAVGALRAAAQGRYGRGAGAEAHAFLLAVARWRGCDSVEKMNDKSTHAQVLAAFDAAIASAESR